MFETLAVGFGRTARRRRRWATAIAASGLFDEAFYRGQGPRLRGRGALDHFVRAGNGEAFWPNPLFDPQWYLDTYRDVRPTGQNALLHYLQDGEPEGRQPNEMFNPKWYAARNGLSSPSGALRHYIEVGSRAGLKPCATFTPRAYVNANRELGLAVADAFSHHLRRRAERRRALEREGKGPRADQPWHSDAYGYVAPLKPDDLDTRIAALPRRPAFTVVMALQGAAPRHLEAALASVQAQWYPHWTLILAAGADAAAEAAVAGIDDPRIAVRQTPEVGLAGRANAALGAARGDYVVFLDGGDALTPDCLYALAGAIAETDADYLYSDEDEIDGAGRASAPFFKPSWSPDALMSLPYARRVACARRGLIAAVGGLREGYDGAEEYDLMLRLTERAGLIEHVPRVLYHRRTATDPAGPQDAVRRAKADALARRGVSGRVEPVAAMPGAWRVNYRPRAGTLASVIVPTRNNGRLAAKLVASIYERTSHPAFEVILIDNGSTEPDTLATLAKLARDGRHPTLRIRQDSSPFNYSALNNAGAAAARGEVLVFLNDDMEIVTPDWLERLIGFAQVPHVGAVGAKLLYPTGEIQHCGIVNLAHGPGHAFYREEPGAPRYHGRDTLDYDWAAVTGACLVIERAKFDAVGGFDESLPIAYNDIDLCFRLLEAGRYNVVCQAVELIHHESISRGSDDSPAREARLAREARRLYARHPRFLGHDPFHSPNLHPDDVRFTPNPN